MRSAINRLASSLLIFVIISSCSKNQAGIVIPAATETSKSPVVENEPAPKPTAFFKITNLVNETTILEGKLLDISVAAVRGITYAWNFGDGSTSNLTVPLYYYATCSRNFTITLTAKNRDGETASYSKSFDIQCSRGTAGNHRPITMPTH